jgi:hypothetical protein
MKTKTYDFKSFINKEHMPPSKAPTMSLIPLAAAPLLTATQASAQEAVQVQAKMMDAFTPIIDLVQAMAYPVAMVVVLGGAIFVMIGNSDKGFSLMQRAGLGYLLVMIAPMIFDVLVDAMKGVAS